MYIKNKKMQQRCIMLSHLLSRMRINVREYRRGNKKKGGVQSRQTRNIGYTIRRKTKQKHSTTCVGHHVRNRNVSMVLKQYLSFYRQVHCGITLCQDINYCWIIHRHQFQYGLWFQYWLFLTNSIFQKH